MKNGFTLIELIVVICILILMLAIFWPIGMNFYMQETLNKTQQQVVWILKQARANAVNQKNNAAFGVQLVTGSAIMFQGNSFETRQQEQDVIYTLATSVNVSGAQTIVFAPNTGFVSASLTIKLSIPAASKEISVNPLGVLEY